MNTPTRRDFLKLFGLGAAGATLSAAGLYTPEPEPVRRYWQVGAQLQSGPRPDLSIFDEAHRLKLNECYDAEKRLRFGRSMGVRDFSEDDRFEPLIIGGKDYPDTGLTFEKPLPHAFEGAEYMRSIGNIDIMLGAIARMKTTPDIWDSLSAMIANKSLADLVVKT